MKHADLEETLRVTLAGRAETVTRGPEWRAPASQLAARRHTARWLAPLAAAAAVAAVVVSVVAIEHRSGPVHVPPATHQPSRTATDSSPTTTPTTTTPPAPTVALACMTGLPARWQQAIRNSLIDIGSSSATVDDIAADGTLVATRDGGVTPGSPRDIVVVAPGQTPRVAYQVSDPDHYTADAKIYGDWLVVELERAQRPPPNTIPNTPPPTVQRLEAVDLRTGDRREITALPAPNSGNPGHNPMIDVVTVIHGRVYWDRRASYSAQRGVIMSYDLSTGATHTEYQGALNSPYFIAASPAGIGTYTGAAQMFVQTQLPAVVQAGIDPQHPLYVATDGTAWAWAVNSHELGWWAPGSPHARHIRLTRALPLTNGPAALVVSSHFVFVNDAVIDLNSGAEAPTVGHGLPSAKFGSFVPIQARDGILYGTEYTGTGHYVNGYWQDPQPQVQRVDTTQLPGLHC